MRAPRPRLLLAAALLVAVSTAAVARALTVYDDTLAAGWASWSWFADIAVDPASATHVHGGAAAIAVTFGSANAALSLRTSPALAGAAWSALDFWVYGAGATGTHLALFTEATDAGDVGSTRDALVAPAGAWTHFVVPLSALGNPATIARVDLQDDGNESVTATFWVDDLTLVPVAPAPVFADGFESGGTGAWCVGCFPFAPLGPLAVTAGTTSVAGSELPSHTLAWSDADGLPRQAVLVDQRNAGTVGAGYLRQLTYRVGGVDRVCTGVASGGGIQGTGYVQNHTGTGGDDWNVGTPGTTTVVLAGRHHAIVQYDMPGFTVAGHAVPTSVQWFFATGRSHPVFAVSQDASASPNLGGDSRTPYGTMDIGCDGSSDAIGGVSWGDVYKFASVVPGTTNESTALSSNSGWRYDEPNSVPYVLAWTSGVDAEEGEVATTSIFAQDQGSDPRVYPATGFGKNQQKLAGPMPQADDWAFQLMNYGLGAGGTTDTKMAWGTNFGFLGGFDNFGDAGLDTSQYSLHRDSTTPFTGTRVDGRKLAYSTYVVFGTHAGGYTGGTTARAVHEVETAALATLTAAIGTVPISGPRGIGPTAGDVVTWSPAGYDAVYGTWEVAADAGAADVTLATPNAAGSLVDPIFVLTGYATATPPASVSLDGATATPDADYFATVDAPHQKLWLTVRRTVPAGSSLRVQVSP